MARPEGGYFKEGRRLVSNTEALGVFKQMMGSQEAIENRGRIGTAAHRATAWLDERGETWDTAPFENLIEFDVVSPEVAGFTRAWEKFKRESGFQLLYDERGKALIEKSFVASRDGYEFATTIDCYAMVFGEPTIVEKKCVRVPDPWWGPQLCGQSLAMEWAYGPPPERPHRRRLIVVQLFSDSRGYKVHDKDKTGLMFDSPQNRRLFLCCLEAETWRRNHGIKF